MQQLSDQGLLVVRQMAARHGFSEDAVTQMLGAVLAGQGGMAQFSHPEFGGSGQWMRGGMIMLGDMFNHQLKGRVDQLCNDCAQVLASRSDLMAAPPAGSGLPGADWWPDGLGSPNATGSQNNLRYAWFAQARRLAVDTGGDVWVYDTLDHQIGGFSQQQGWGSGITLSSQYGNVALGSLPVVMRHGQAVTAAAPAPAPALYAQTPAAAPVQQSSSGTGSGDVFQAIERLGDLLSRGLLTEQEFATKKAELLSRL